MDFTNILLSFIAIFYVLSGLIQICKDLLNKDSDIDMVAFIGNLILVLGMDKFMFDSFFIITLLQLMGDWIIELLNLLSAFFINLELFIIALSSLFSQPIIYEPMDVVTWLVQTITIMLLVFIGALFYCVFFVITTICYAYFRTFIQLQILHNYQSKERTEQC